MPQVVGIRFKKAGKIYYFDPGTVEPSLGDTVILETARGMEMGQVVMARREVEESDLVAPLRNVVRIATEDDIEQAKANQDKEKDAAEICRKKIRQHKLEMNLTGVEYTFDGSRIIFYFTADGRIDFRELVKDLVSEFRIRIELRQIGVRDESRVLGGIGVCGRTLCCHGLTDKLCPVSIKMAKVQNLSLNSMKISGPCGRLLCCLYYEHDFYVGEKQRFPDEGIRIPYDETVFRITEVNIISRQIRLAGEDGRYISLPVCRFERDPQTRRWKILDGAGCPAAANPELSG